VPGFHFGDSPGRSVTFDSAVFRVSDPLRIVGTYLCTRTSVSRSVFGFGFGISWAISRLCRLSILVLEFGLELVFALVYADLER